MRWGRCRWSGSAPRRGVPLLPSSTTFPYIWLLAALPAFLLEVTFYYTLGVETMARAAGKAPAPAVALALTVAAVAPYCAAALAFGFFRWRFAGGDCFAGAAGIFLVRPAAAQRRGRLLFVVLMAAVFLANFERAEYDDPYPKLQL